jgi:hypothetical protein
MVCVTVAGTVLAVSQLAPVELLSDFTSSNRTLSSFSSGSSSLSVKLRNEVKSFVDKNPDAQSATCTGLVLKGASKSTVSLAKNRATAACSYVKRLEPGVSTKVATKITTVRSFAGRVTVTLRAPVEEVESAPIANPAPVPAPVVAPPKEKTANELLSERIVALYKSSGANKSYEFDLKLCPNTNLAKSNETVDAYKEATRFWSTYFTPKVPLKWVMFSEKDYSCWLESVNALEGPSGDKRVWNKDTNVMGHCQLSSRAFCGYGTGVRRDGIFVQYNAIGSEYANSPVAFTVHHEAVHLYQMALQSELGRSATAGQLPPWFIEGQANVIGATVANNGTFVSHRNFEIGRIKNVIPGAGAFDENQWYSKILELDNSAGFVFQNELGYSLGWLILEKFYQKYSMEQMHDLLVKVYSGASWESAIATALGTTKEAIYKEASKYLADEVN